MKKKISSMEMDDYLKHLAILSDALDKVMNDCGFVYPASIHLRNGIEGTLEAIKNQAMIDLGVDIKVKEILGGADTNHEWDWNKEFLEWRKERGCVVSRGRKERQ